MLSLSVFSVLPGGRRWIQQRWSFRVLTRVKASPAEQELL